jgi:hypothetical protein
MLDPIGKVLALMTGIVSESSRCAVFRFALALVLAGSFGVTSCSSHLEGPGRAVADLEGSAAVGMSYVDFLHKLQSLGSAIALAKQEGASETALRPYTDAFEIYMSAQALWKQKIDCPAAFQFGDPDSCPTERIFGVVRDLAAKYNVTFDQYDEAGIRAYEKMMEAREKEVKQWVDRGMPGGYAPFRQPAYQLQRANGDVFDKLLSTMWKKAAQTAKQ